MTQLNRKWILVLFCMCCNLFSDNSININDLDKKINFAKQLQDNNDYINSIIEYKRVNAYYPDNKYYYDNLFSISLCYYYNGQFIESINSSKELLHKNKNHWDSIINVIRSYKNIKYFYESNDFIDSYIPNFILSKRDSLIMYSVVNDIYLEDIISARNKLNKIENMSVLYNTKENFIDILDNDYRLNLKNKNTATLMSVFPGGGYLYTNNYQTFIASLVVNSLLYYAVSDSFNNGNDGMGYLCSIFSIGFYFGSMTGSWQSVDRYNKSVKLENFRKFDLVFN